MDYSADPGKYSYYIGEVSPDEKWYAAFEDTGEAAYLYLGKNSEDEDKREIHDHLWIYNAIMPPIEECKEVFILWSEDSLRVGIIVDQECWGIYDLKTWRKINAPREGNEIKPIPFEFWDKGLTLTDGEQIKPLL